MGRPTKFSQERADAICEMLARGSTRKDAAEAAGISYDTLLGWLKLGEAARSGRFFQFFGALTRAEADCAARMAAAVEKAATGYQSQKVKRTFNPDGTVVEEVTTSTEVDWRAGLEWLKRRRRQEWGDNLSLAVVQKAAEQVKGMSDADLLAILAGAGADPAADGGSGGAPPGPAVG